MEPFYEPERTMGASRRYTSVEGECIQLAVSPTQLKRSGLREDAFRKRSCRIAERDGRAQSREVKLETQR